MTQRMPVFDPYAEDFLADQHATYGRLRAEAPVYYNPELDFYALTRYDDVAAAYRDHETYSSTAGFDLAMVKSDEDPPSAILFMDPPDHRRMRGLVSRAFTPRAIGALRDTVTELVRRHLAGADPRQFDVVTEFAALFPVDVVSRLAGIPDDAVDQVRIWMDQIHTIDPGEMHRSASALESLGEMFTFLYELVLARRADLRGDMISELIEAEVIRDDGVPTRLDDLEITSFVLLLGGAGAETVTKMIGNAVEVFAAHPDQWQALAQHRDRVPAAVEELLRYAGPVRYNVRCTRREVTLHGVTIPPGKPVLLCCASANRDPEAFADPDVFDIERERPGAVHLGLGYGIHSCLGAALGRMETSIALHHLLDVMPRYEVEWSRARRSATPTMTGWSSLPVRVVR